LRFVTSNPPVSDPGAVNPHDTIVEQKIGQQEKSADEIDFGDAFESTPSDSISGSTSDTAMGIQNHSSIIKVTRSSVRILLMQSTTAAVFYSVGNLEIRSSRHVSPPLRGRVSIHASANKKSSISVEYNSKVHEYSLPCTLISPDSYSFIDVNQDSYRGSMVIVAETKGRFSVVNHLEIEDYLRGVVPLEIGKRPEIEIEALKAQAIAARTYTYKRMFENYRRSFDLWATVKDQVYGGANAEYRFTDNAIKMTKDIILTYGDSIINAYYHSTCGGQTATIEQVWDKPQAGYLKSIRDIDSSGKAYCSISPSFTWQESWTKKQFNSIIANSLSNMYPQKKFNGSVSDVSVNEFLPCGRIKSCTIKGSHWSLDIGGDKVRFVVRRTSENNPILRSANFKVISMDSKNVILSGKGYGHGIGMCQMGAIGRAQSGQSFEQILKAYYTGVSLSQVVKE
jgi:stage II sporulation protein D